MQYLPLSICKVWKKHTDKPKEKENVQYKKTLAKLKQGIIKIKVHIKIQKK